MKSIFFPVVSILFCLSCKKETPIIKPDPCENAYDLRSKPYTSIFEGWAKCPITPKFIYPEKYSYYAPCTNPKNDYEFCFLRLDNSTQVKDFCKYNFCTNQTTVLMKDNNTSCAWSVKDWLLFIKNENELWKMKSNGDSSIRIGTTLFNFGSWSPDGSKLINDSKLLDENGKFISDLSSLHDSYLVWETDSTIFYPKIDKINKKFDIYRYNLKNNSSKRLYTRANATWLNIDFFSQKDSYLYLKTDDAASSLIYLRLDTKTGLSTIVKTYQGNYVPLIYGQMKDKFLVNLNLRDTLTSLPCSINIRHHIALMNLDGTNERQVILPE